MKIRYATYLTTILSVFYFGDILSQPIYDYSPDFKRLEAGIPKDANHIPGFSLIIINKESILGIYNVGVEELNSRKKITENSLFNIASISKTFTAAAILKLWEDKKLNLSDFAIKYIPELPSYMATIQIYHLLTHTSGIPDYERVPGEYLNENSQVVKELTGYDSLNFDPLTKYEYNNRAYVLLAMIIENVTKKTYSNYLREVIFGPLNMHDTFVNQEMTTTHTAAVGYTYDEASGEYKINDSRPDQTYGSTGIYSSTRDLVKWYLALKENKIINQRSKNLMFNYPVTTSGQFSYISMGWFNETLGKHDPELIGLRKRGAIGETFGFRGIMEMYIDNDFGYICLSNAGDFPKVTGGFIANCFFTSEKKP